MKKFLAILTSFLIFASLVLADVKIERKNRIENIDPGYCAWASLETLGRHHKIKQLYNLVKNRTKEYDYEKDGIYYKWIDYGNHKEAQPINTGGLRAIANKLKELGIKFRYHNGYNRDLIHYAMKHDLGCVIACQAEGFGMEGPGSHAVVLTNFEQNRVSFIDPNDINNVYSANMAWFNKYWIGYTIVVEP